MADIERHAANRGGSVDWREEYALLREERRSEAARLDEAILAAAREVIAAEQRYRIECEREPDDARREELAAIRTYRIERLDTELRARASAAVDGDAMPKVLLNAAGGLGGHLDSCTCDACQMLRRDRERDQTSGGSTEALSGVSKGEGYQSSAPADVDPEPARAPEAAGTFEDGHRKGFEAGKAAQRMLDDHPASPNACKACGK